jgi:hypothetical protein
LSRDFPNKRSPRRGICGEAWCRLKRSHPTIRSMWKRRQNAPFPSRPSSGPLDHLWSATAACPLRKLYHRSHFAPAPDAARRDGRLAPRRGNARPAAAQEPVPTAPASSFADLVSSLKTDQPPVQPIDLSNRSGRSQLLRCRRADALNVFEAVSNTDRAQQIGVKDGWRWKWPNEVAAEHRSALQLRPSIRAASAFQSGNRFTRPAVRSRTRPPPISAYPTCVSPYSRASHGRTWERPRHRLSLLPRAVPSWNEVRYKHRRQHVLTDAQTGKTNLSGKLGR